MIPAGSHPFDLDVVHADLGPEALLRHLAADHAHPVDRRMGAAVAQHTHRELHEMTTDTTSDVAGLLDRLEEARQAATAGPWQYDPETPGEMWDIDLDVIIGGCEEPADAALIVAAVNALPELLRLARQGQALEAGVLALAEELQALADERDSGSLIAVAERSGLLMSLHRLRALVADTTGEAGQ